MKQGWGIKKLGDVCEELFAGGDVPKNNSSKIKSDDFNIPIFSNGEKNKGLYGYTNVVRVKKPSITISARGTIGYPAIRDEAFYPAIRLIVATPNTEILDLFFLKYIIGSIDFIHSGSSIPQLTVPMIKEYPIPVPTLPEQRLIVSILDEAFSAIATAKANAEQNLKNAKELFESYLQAVFENNGNNWEEVKLSELAIDITDGDHMPPPKTNEGVPFITITNINKQSHRIDFSDTFTVSQAYFQKLKRNRKPQMGDVLYTVTGSYGIPVLIEDDFEFCFQRHIGLIRPKGNISSKWLYYWILSPQAFMQANDTATGTAQKTVSLTALRNFIVPKMPLKVQQSIVQKLDALSEETKRLESIYQKKIVDLEELKKSVLQKAFNGELS